MQLNAPVIFTVGHSSVSFERFASLLRAYQIEVVVDVRSQPASRVAPHFGRRTLALLLRRAGLRYAFLGDALGGRPNNSQFYDDEGHILYAEWSQAAPFQEGLDRLRRGATAHSVAIMCSEESPLTCHRRLLIARALSQNGWPRSRIVHIRGDGLCMPEDTIPAQSGPFAEGIGWRSPRSVLRGPQRNTSSSA